MVRARLTFAVALRPLITLHYHKYSKCVVAPSGRRIYCTRPFHSRRKSLNSILFRVELTWMWNCKCKFEIENLGKKWKLSNCDESNETHCAQSKRFSCDSVESRSHTEAEGKRQSEWARPFRTCYFLCVIIVCSGQQPAASLVMLLCCGTQNGTNTRVKLSRRARDACAIAACARRAIFQHQFMPWPSSSVICIAWCCGGAYGLLATSTRMNFYYNDSPQIGLSGALYGVGCRWGRWCCRCGCQMCMRCHQWTGRWGYWRRNGVGILSVEFAIGTRTNQCRRPWYTWWCVGVFRLCVVCRHRWHHVHPMLLIRFRCFIADNRLLRDLNFGQAIVTLMQSIVANCVSIGTRANVICRFGCGRRYGIGWLVRCAYRFGVGWSISFGDRCVCVYRTMSEQQEVARVRAHRFGAHFRRKGSRRWSCGSFNTLAACAQYVRHVLDTNRGRLNDLCCFLSDNRRHGRCRRQQVQRFQWNRCKWCGFGFCWMGRFDEFGNWIGSMVSRSNLLMNIFGADWFDVGPGHAVTAPHLWHGHYADRMRSDGNWCRRNWRRWRRRDWQRCRGGRLFRIFLDDTLNADIARGDYVRLNDVCIRSRRTGQFLLRGRRYNANVSC